MGHGSSTRKDGPAPREWTARLERNTGACRGEMQIERIHEQIHGHPVVDRDVYGPMARWSGDPHRHLLGVERDFMFVRFANHEIAKFFFRGWRCQPEAVS